MPVLIANYQEKATVTKVKKFYSTFSQAYLMAVNDHGTIDNWGLTNSELVEDEDGNIVHSDESFENYEKFFDIIEPYMQSVCRDTTKNGSNKKEDKKGYVFADGTAIVGMWLSPENCNESKPNSVCGDFYFNTDSKTKSHVNGKLDYNKKVFSFNIMPNKITPRGTDSLFDFCKNGTNYTYCTGWVVVNGNMDYLHCPDKLGWNKARSCK